MQNHHIYKELLVLIRPEQTFYAALCCGFFPDFSDYEETVKYLHPQEYHYYHSLRFEKRIRSYLLGRFVAKQAVAALTGARDLPEIFIQSGIFTQPVVIADKKNIQVSITHCDDFGAALAFPEAHPMGIDIEKTAPDKIDVLESQMTKTEKERLKSLPLSYETGLTLFWTAKEALSKVLKTGLMTPFEVFEISEVEWGNHLTMCYYKNFSQYKVISFAIGSYLCSIVHPLKTELHFDLHALKTNFALFESGNEVDKMAL